MNDFTDKSAVVTGGSSGIGLAIAKKLASLGAHVHLVARRAAELESARREVAGVRESTTQLATAHECDVADRGQVAKMAEAVRSAGVRPSIVVNSAGISRPGYFRELPPDAFEQMVQVNYLGTVWVTRVFLEDLESSGAGHIVNVSSVAGLMGVFGFTAYSASKFAVGGFTESLRAELADSGVQVHLLCPPDVDTPMLHREEALLPPETRVLSSSAGVLSADEVADALVRGMKSGARVIVPGKDARFIAFAHRHAPGLVNAIIQRKIRRSRGR